MHLNNYLNRHIIHLATLNNIIAYFLDLLSFSAERNNLYNKLSLETVQNSVQYIC